jgi:hypothetical protein
MHARNELANWINGAIDSIDKLITRITKQKNLKYLSIVIKEFLLLATRLIKNEDLTRLLNP